MINTPAPTKETEKIQLVKAHREKNRIISKKENTHFPKHRKGASISRTKKLSNQILDAEPQKVTKHPMRKEQVSTNQDQICKCSHIRKRAHRHAELTLSNQINVCKFTFLKYRSENHAVKIVTNQIRQFLIYSQLRHI